MLEHFTPQEDGKQFFMQKSNYSSATLVKSDTLSEAVYTSFIFELIYR
jgi:hypothetical protein